MSRAGGTLLPALYAVVLGAVAAAPACRPDDPQRRHLQQLQSWQADVGLERRDGAERIVRITFRGRKVPASLLISLDRYLYLEWLDLYGTDLTDAEWELVPRLPQLKYLNLAGTQLSDEALQRLGKQEQLHTLSVSPLTTDRGLEALAGLPRLHSLYLGDTQVAGPGLAGLTQLPLKSLWLDRSRIDDEGMEFVGKLTGLERLGLGQTRITDAGLQHVRPLSSLDFLSLADTAIGDESIPLLLELKRLFLLEVPGTRLTPEGLRRLRAELPEALVAVERTDRPTWWPER